MTKTFVKVSGTEEIGNIPLGQLSLGKNSVVLRPAKNGESFKKLVISAYPKAWVEKSDYEDEDEFAVFGVNDELANMYYTSANRAWRKAAQELGLVVVV